MGEAEAGETLVETGVIFGSSHRRNNLLST